MKIQEASILNLEWSSGRTRDNTTMFLICNYLQLQGAHVTFRNINDGLSEINRIRPDLLLVANSVGSVENHAVVKYAKSRGALAVTLMSEGNIQGGPKQVSEMIWGWNRDKVLYEDLQMLWSQRARNVTLDMHPELAPGVAVSGGVGFDHCAISRGSTRPTRLKSVVSQSGFRRVVGVGCWDFGCYYPQDPRYGAVQRIYPEAVMERFRSDGLLFNAVLKTVVAEHPDILFVIKVHPGETLGDMASGIEGLRGLHNVLVTKDEYAIRDCIAVSDLWLVYESTSALEAWLLGKQTCLLNPSGRDFTREQHISEGSPEFLSAADVRDAIASFYADGELPGFTSRASSRDSAIREIIEYGDGLNHVRAGNRILGVIEAAPGRVAYRAETTSQSLDRLKWHAKWLAYPYYGRSRKNYNFMADRSKYQVAEIKEFCSDLMGEQQRFYADRSLTMPQLRGIE